MDRNYSLEAAGTLNVSQIESEVGVCVDGLKSLKTKVDAAISKATKARSLSSDAKGVTLHWWKIGDKAKAIESLQSAMVGVSDAQSEQAEAMQMILQYQRDVANGMKFLFGLGAANMVANRTVVKEIELRLRDATEEEIGEMARKELAGVMAQLKLQLDLHERQDKLAKDQSVVKSGLKANQDAIVAIERKDVEQDERIADNDKIDAAQNAELKRQAEKDAELDRLIAKNADGISAHGAAIKTNARGIAETKNTLEGVKLEHARLAEELRSADNEQDEEIERQARMDKELDEKTLANKRRIAANAEEIEHNAKMISELEERLRMQRHAIAQNKHGILKGRAAVVMAAISLGVSIVALVVAFVR